VSIHHLDSEFDALVARLAGPFGAKFARGLSSGGGGRVGRNSLPWAGHRLPGGRAAAESVLRSSGLASRGLGHRAGTSKHQQADRPTGDRARCRRTAFAVSQGGRLSAMAYWACARLEPQREHLALHCLGLAGYETYLPRIRERRVSKSGRVEVSMPLFPGYAFVAIELQWHAARWTAGVLGLILAGDRPARVPDRVIDEIRAREVRGLVELPKAKLKSGTPVRVLRGPLEGKLDWLPTCARVSEF
jgi:transcriptional antiterminator RfaH